MNRSVAVRILILATIIGLFGQALLFGNLLGINAPILSGALLAAAFVLRPADRQMDPLDRWIPVLAIAFSLGIAIRADPVLLQLDGAAACLFLGASMAAITGEAVTRRSVAVVVVLGLLVVGWVAIGILRVTKAVRQPAQSAVDDRPPMHVPASVGAVARGLLLALPILAIFAALFAAADAVFDRLISGLFAWNIDLGELPLRFAIAFFIAWAVAGLLAVAVGVIGDEAGAWWSADAGPGVGRSPRAQSLGAAAAGLPEATDRESAGLGFHLGAIEAATILVAVDVLFAVFVALQLAYLFGGQDTLAATGLPYAQYARSGFFELVWAATLAGGLLATVHALAARRTRLLVGSGLALAGLTAVVLASALLRLRIYQDAYGWTELRFYVLAAIVWLAIGIAITIVLLARDRMGWLLHGLAIAAAVVLLGVNVVGPIRLIAEENVARVLNPALVPPDGRSGLDVRYAVSLGDDAIPALVAALPALDAADRRELVFHLRLRRDELAAPETLGWPSWNLGRDAARRALATLDH